MPPDRLVEVEGAPDTPKLALLKSSNKQVFLPPQQTDDLAILGTAEKNEEVFFIVHIVEENITISIDYRRKSL